MRRWYLLFLLATLMTACDFDLPDEALETSAAVPMDELAIPDGFDFGTTKAVRLQVNAVDADGNALHRVPFEVMFQAEDELIKLLTATTGNEGLANLELSLPADVDSLIFHPLYLGLPAWKVVAVSSPALSVTLGEENQEGFTGGGDDAQFFANLLKNSTEATSTEAVLGSRSIPDMSYLGTYTTTGKPNYLTSPNDVVNQSLLDVVNASLPEGQPVPTYHPEYLEGDIASTINLIEDAEIWITFVHEGAGYKNALGFYSYPTDTPPASPDDLEALTVIFPNASFQGSGGSLVTGNKVSIGTFPAGTTLGWFLVPNGWNGTTKKVDYKSNTKFADNHFNTFTSAQYRRHIVSLYDQSLEKVILGMEDLDRPGGDNDFNDAVFYLTASTFSAIQTDNLAVAVNNDDDDEDGVSNAQDIAPNDPTIAFAAYTPGQGVYGSFAFEDLFPHKGDYDMNDVVVDYNFKEYLNASNQIVKMETSLILRATGGVTQNGFGFELGVAPDKIAEVTGSQISGGSLQFLPSGVEAGQEKAVVIAYDDGHALFDGGSNRTYVNTQKGQAEQEPVELDLTVIFTEPIAREYLGLAPFNPFIFTGGLRGKEIHLRNYPPTSLANVDFFGSGDDA
ncbi:MAG: LruC domain-containing protein, partial [Bacteroidota bacterium]